MEIDGPSLSFLLKDAMLYLAGDLSSVKEFKWFLSLNSWHRRVHLSGVAQRVFFHHQYVCSRGVAWRECARLTLSPVPVSSGWVWLGWHADAQWRSCESRLHTHTYTHTQIEIKHSLGNKTHTWFYRDLFIPNYSSDTETLQSRKHLPFPHFLHVNTNVLFEKRERGPI